MKSIADRTVDDLAPEVISLLRAITTVVGEDASLFMQNKKHDWKRCIARCVFCGRLQGKFTLCRIGDMINRSHGTVSYYHRLYDKKEFIPQLNSFDEEIERQISL